MATKNPRTGQSARASKSTAADKRNPTQNALETQPDSPRYHRGQRYDLAGIEPHTRKDGSDTLLAVWASHCAKCGEPFTFRAPLRAGQFQPNRRCAAHKAPGVRV